MPAYSAAGDTGDHAGRREVQRHLKVEPGCRVCFILPSSIRLATGKQLDTEDADLMNLSYNLTTQCVPAGLSSKPFRYPTASLQQTADEWPVRVVHSSRPASQSVLPCVPETMPALEDADMSFCKHLQRDWPPASGAACLCRLVGGAQQQQYQRD
jgi:hypothetical protein